MSAADRIIFNRAHYAELVYSRLYRNGNPFTRQEIEALETTIEQKGLVIYCSLPVELIKARLSERNQSAEVLKPEPTSLEELEHMGLEFDDVFRNKAVIRYSAVVPDDLTSLLLEEMKKWVSVGCLAQTRVPSNSTAVLTFQFLAFGKLTLCFEPSSYSWPSLNEHLQTASRPG